MNCRPRLIVTVLVAALRLVVRAESTEAPVILDPYRVNSYLENYAAGSSFSALRVNAPLLEIPLSTSVITSALMLDQGLGTVNDAMRNVAGVQTVQGGTEFQNYYFTRGMPNFYYRDGVRMDLSGGNITPNVFGLENAEILKGPSSILYGRGTPGGIVNFNSKRPLPTARAMLAATAGSEGHLRADLDATGPIGKEALYRFTGSVDRADSYRNEVDSRTTYAAPTATVNVGSASQLTLLVDYAEQKLTPDGGIATRPNGTLPVWVNDGTNFALSFNRVSPRTALVDYRSARYLAELQSKVTPDDQLRVSVTHMRFAHRRSEMAGNMLDSAAVGVPGMLGPDQLIRVWNSKSGHRDLDVVRVENVLEFSHDVAGARLGHQLLLSAEYGRTVTEMTSAMQDHELLGLKTPVALPVWQYFAQLGLGTTKDGQLIFDNSTEHTVHRDLAAAVQDNIRLSDAWRLLVGLRYEENKGSLDTVRTNYMIGLTPAPMSSHVVSEATKGRLLPRLGLLVKASPQVAVYGNYLTSFIPAGATQIGKSGLIAPETGDQFEAGIKYDAIPNRLFATLAVFQINRHDIATYYTDMTTLAAYWKATDAERSSGAEVELTGAVTPALNLVAHLGYLDNESTVSDVPAKRGRMRHALSHVTASAWATYALPFEAAKGWRVGAGLFHSGPQYLEDYNTVELGGRTICDAMVGYTRQHWNAQLNVRNVFNRHYYLPSGNGYNDPAYSPAAYNTAVQTVIPAAGTEWQLSVSYVF